MLSQRQVCSSSSLQGQAAARGSACHCLTLPHVHGSWCRACHGAPEVHGYRLTAAWEISGCLPELPAPAGLLSQVMDGQVAAGWEIDCQEKHGVLITSC